MVLIILVIAFGAWMIISSIKESKEKEEKRFYERLRREQEEAEKKRQEEEKRLRHAENINKMKNKEFFRVVCEEFDKQVADSARRYVKNGGRIANIAMGNVGVGCNCIFTDNYSHGDFHIKIYYKDMGYQNISLEERETLIGALETTGRVVLDGNLVVLDDGRATLSRGYYASVLYEIEKEIGLKEI